MTTATEEDVSIFLPVLETTDWATLQEALAAATVEPEPAAAEPPEQAKIVETEPPAPLSSEAASIAAEAESVYRAVALAPQEVTAYMEYAFDTAPGSRQERLERLIAFAPTWWEASQLVETFTNERLLSGGLYNLLRELQHRWLEAELGILPGKAKWLRAIGMEPFRVSLSPDLGPVDWEMLKQLPRMVEIGASPSGPSFADRLGRMLEEDAKKRQQEYLTRKRLQREDWRRLDQLASRRRRRIRGERVEEDEDPREAEALLAASMKRWTPEMIEWALYATRVKILGVQVSAIIRNSLLSVEQKKRRIADAKAGKVDWCIFPVDPETCRSELAELREILERVVMSATEFFFEIVPASPLAGTTSPWPLWDNLQLLETELHPIYTHLANLRVEFRSAEMWAEAKRGPAEQRGRVDMIDRDRATGPVPLVTARDQRLVAVFREATATQPAAPLDRPSQLAMARAATENARCALGDWQSIADPTEKELAVPEVRYLIKVARRAQRKLSSPLPGAATGNRRRAVEKRLPLLKAARLRRKAEAKSAKKPVAENKPRRKKDRAA